MFGLTRKDWSSLLPILLLFSLVSTFRLGASGLIEPNEPFYALTAKEMLQRGEWVVPTLFGQPQFEKPVLAYWVYLIFFSLFGVNEWAARLGPFVAALGTLAATAVLAKTLFGRTRTMVWSVLILASAGFFITLSRVVLTDMFLCLFTTAAFACYARGWKEPSARPVAWHLFFAFIGLGLLAKGPLGALLPLGSAALFKWSSSRGSRIPGLPWRSGLLVTAAVAAPWYAAAAWRHDWFLGHFFWHENVRRFFVAEHASMDTPYFYPLVLLFGFFPWSFLLLSALQVQWRAMNPARGGHAPARRYLLLSAAWMFVFFSCSSSKLMSYIFPIFPVLAVLAGDAVSRWTRLARGGLSAGFRRALFWNWAVLPALLVGGVVWYAVDHHLGLTGQILAAGSLCVLPCAAAYGLARKGRLAAALGVTAGMSAVFSLAAFGWIMPMTERFFSSRAIVNDFRRDGLDPSAGTLLASKMSVRGVSYYADNPHMAVVTGNPQKTFYTPHPIPMISRAQDLDRIPREHYPLYGILRPKEVRHLKEISQGRYALKVLDANSQRSIIRLERHEI